MIQNTITAFNGCNTVQGDVNGSPANRSVICMARGCNNPATRVLKLPIAANLCGELNICEDCVPKFSQAIVETGV
jgi:hypothetical protein